MKSEAFPEEQRLYTLLSREVKYLRHRLDENTILDEMDSCLEAEMLRKIPKGASEMYL